jgi:hypothetical protein
VSQPFRRVALCVTASTSILGEVSCAYVLSGGNRRDMRPALRTSISLLSSYDVPIRFVQHHINLRLGTFTPVYYCLAPEFA